jgi:replicative DNA helicase Mcm
MDELPIHRPMRFQKNARWTGERVETHEIPPVANGPDGSGTGAIAVPMDLWLEFLGYFLSEGVVEHRLETGVPYRVRIMQKPGEKADTIRACLERLPFVHSHDGQAFAITAEQLAIHLAPLGEGAAKRVPGDVKGLCQDQLRILLDALVLGDGHVDPVTGTTVYATPSERLADDVTELLLKAGWSGNRYRAKACGVPTAGKRGGASTGTLDVRQVAFVRDGQNESDVNSNGQRQIRVRPYRGRVYCVEVPNHVVYVRRNGIPVWCGNSISVAKAGITATLKSRCALLGAANPKLGRFDEYADIGEQINMPPSLLSRFDLIFILADKPDHKRDEAIAEHILKAHGIGELIAQHARDPIDGVDDDYIQRELAPVTPEIEPAMLRKYVAYAKRTCFPILSPDAKDVLVGYYMRLRDLADANKPVPVTARQLEALVRLAEASARVRLAKTITAPDAERVVRIVDTCLRQVAYDPKTGTFDIDKVATGISKGRRDLIRAIKEAIRENGDISGRAQIAQVTDVLVQQGFSRDDVKKQVEYLLRSGEAMEPKNGVIKLI